MNRPQMSCPTTCQPDGHSDGSLVGSYMLVVGAELLSLSEGWLKVQDARITNSKNGLRVKQITEL